MAGNGDVLSTTSDEYNLNANSKIIQITSFNGDILVGNNRDISVWEESRYSAVFYFPIDKYLLLRNYRSNNASLAALDILINTIQITENIDTIEIVGACSPVGNEDYNMKLALSRCMAMRSYLRWKHLEFAEKYPIKFTVVGVDRKGYRFLKKERPALSEEQIWDMLQYTTIHFKMKDGSRVILGPDRQESSLDSKKNKPIFNNEVQDNEAQVDTPTHTKSNNIRDTLFLKQDTAYLYIGKNVKPAPTWYAALKTNLLYDAALLPNLTAELYIGRKWSLAVEGNWSWWTFGRPIQNQWHHRIQTAGVELRKWVKSPYPLQGHALGIYSMIGNYDVRLFTENEYSKGWLSYWSWSAGLSYSYSFPIARRFNLELGLAFGYMGGQYYQYDYCMAHEHWAPRSIHNRNYIGPARIGISLVWRLGGGNDEKSRNNHHAQKKQKYQ
ncbi:MAG: DUF3575 domain-containing protein [Dysgonamonadaceae bacterium]|nr:DUF3575 domain-containing protein [Dysgonamonadaceae bacterium]